MARNESDHEDLMTEAVSLLKRIEFRCPSRSELCLAGINAQGWLSVYLGTDPMYRFDEVGRLRRAFVGGKLFRTEGGTLAMMERHRSSTAGANAVELESSLLRQDLSPDQLESFRQQMLRDLNELLAALIQTNITRQHPEDSPGIVDEIGQAIRQAISSPEFLAPPIVRRRST